jgi:hypothetical protein
MPFFVFGETASPQGVWSGTIGTKAIVACFNDNGYGSYYYIDYLKPISLSKGGYKDHYLHEHNDTGRWELAVPVNGTVAGTWSNEKTGKTLPIHLALVDGDDDESACVRNSYNLRLGIIKPKIEKGEIIQFSLGRSYRKLQFARQETIELFGADPALGKINSSLKPNQSKEAIDDYLVQWRESWERLGYPLKDELCTEPIFWDSNFIMVGFHRWYAGTGTGGISDEYRTWSTQTGEEVDLWQWIGSNSEERELSPELEEFLYKDFEESPGCTDYYGQGNYELRLDKAGLYISETAISCGVGFFVPYEKLLPFLTPAGKEAVRSIKRQQ